MERLLSTLQRFDAHLQSTSFTSLFFEDDDLDAVKGGSASSSPSSTAATAAAALTDPAKRKVLNASEGLRLSVLIMGLLMTCYVIGYFHLSVLWSLVLVLLCVFGGSRRREERSKRREDVFMASMLHQERHLRALTELPNWVSFPQLENAQWYVYA